MALGFATALAATYAIPAYAAVPGSDHHVVEGGRSAQGFIPQALTVAENDGATVTREGYTIVEAPEPEPIVQPSAPNIFYARAATFTNNPNSPIQWPFDFGVPITDGFGSRNAPCSGCSSDHQGLDMAPGAGTPIQAIAGGVVSEVGDSPGGYGVYVMIEHQIDGQTVTSLYAHMREGSVAMAVGDQVAVRQLVGLVGNTGASTGAHLHLGISIDGNPTDPYAWLTSKVQQQ